MALEIQNSSQRFGSILRDRNQNASFFQKNLKSKDINQISKSLGSDENSWIETLNNNIRIRLNEKPISGKSRLLESPPKETVSKRNGASSLVQIWEARLNPSSGGNSPSHNQSTASSSRSDSGFNNVHDSHFLESSDIAEDESLDRTVEIESDLNGSVSDSGRVADLVRRLTNEEKLIDGENGGGGGGGGLKIIRTPKPCIPSSSPSEKNNFPMVNLSRKIRGRQAFTDLLMQLERDRHRELELLLEAKAVSKFSQRGRLQTMLKLRSLKRCKAIQDQNRFTAITTGLNRVEPSAVLHLREKFRTKTVSTAATADQRKDHRRSADKHNKTVEETKVTEEKTRLSEKSGITIEAFFTERLSLRNRKMEEVTLCQKEETVNRRDVADMSCLQLQETRETKEETVNRTNVADMSCLQLQETKETCNDGESEKKEDQKSVAQESFLEKNINENKIENFIQETPETESMLHEGDQCLEQQETSYLNGWEEQEEYEDEQFYYGEPNNDWLSEISRPRSYWEELRKSRYEEVEKEDIKRLLERRTVTDFLESGLREQIDKLMMSRVQTHSYNHSENWELQQEEEEEEEKADIEEAIEEEQDDRDDLSRSSSSQIFASSPAGSWSSQDTEVTPTPVLSVPNPHSPEMELISGMRLQIQELQQEMSLLRDTVKTCLEANRENPMKRKCYVCDETQVEAVLYKCGHMCTCLKCANELQWSGGKCPICRAQIIDVVRVSFDTRN